MGSEDRHNRCGRSRLQRWNSQPAVQRMARRRRAPDRHEVVVVHAGRRRSTLQSSSEASMRSRVVPDGRTTAGTGGQPTCRTSAIGATVINTFDGAFLVGAGEVGTGRMKRELPLARAREAQRGTPFTMRPDARQYDGRRTWGSKTPML